MAIYDTNNHICRQTNVLYLFWSIGFVLVCSDFVALISAIHSDELETRFHEVRSVGVFFFDNPLMAEFVLSVGEVLLGVLDVGIQLRVVVVEGLFGHVLPLGLGLGGTHDQLVLVHGLGNADSICSSNHIGIRTERWDGVIEIVAERGLLMLVLSASS